MKVVTNIYHSVIGEKINTLRFKATQTLDYFLRFKVWCL